MKICPDCGKQNPDEARFCLQCGKALSEQRTNTAASSKVRICPKCGGSNGPSAPFCAECGATLSGIVPTEQKSLKRASPPNRTETLAFWSKLRIAQIILNIALILASVICLILGMEEMWYFLGFAIFSILEFAFPNLQLRYVTRYCKKFELSDEYYIRHYIAGWIITVAGICIFLYMLFTGTAFP